MFATFLLLAACQDTTLAKVNEGPVAVILSPADGDSFTAGASLTLRGSGSDADDDPDELLARWYLDEVEACADAAPAADGTTTCTVTLPDAPVRVQLEVRDPTGEVGVDFVDLVIEPGGDTGDSGDTGDDTGDDAPPTAAIVAPLDGAVLTEGDTLAFAGMVADAEDAPADLIVAWVDSLDGALSPDPTSDKGSTGGSFVPSVGAHSLTLQVTDAAGQRAEAVVAYEVVAPNAPPTAPGVTIDPASPTEGDGLRCAVVTPSTDPDGDAISYTFAWTVDGSPFTDTDTTDAPGDTIPAGVTTVGASWTCFVTPDDGVDAGPPGTATVSIGVASACADGNCALRFDGSGDYVEVPHHASLDGGGRALTVEAWVWYDSVSSNCMTTVRKGTASSPTYDYWLHKNMSPGDSLFWGSWSAWTTQAFGAVSDGRWYHYAGTYDPGSGGTAIWLDGALVSSSAGSGTPTVNGDPLRIGIDWDFGCATDGIIDEVRISSVVRYTAPFAPATTFAADADTLALWHFDEATGAVAFDASGNGNHGAIVGATWTTESP